MKKFRSVAVVATSFALTALFGGPAFAHATLTETFPADGAEATELSEIGLTANEELLDLGDGAGFVFSVTDADGHFYGDGCVVVDGSTASMPVVLGEAGTYSVAYRVVSADGHPIEGAWSFKYAPSKDALIGEAYLKLPGCGETPIPVAQPTPEPEPTATETPVENTDTFDVIPFIGLATIPLVIGGIWLLMRSLGKRDSEDHLT